MIPQAILNWFLGRGQKQIGADLIDRLTSFWAAHILVLFALVISAKQFGGEPINCWMPVSFSRSQEEYTEDFCLQSHHYSVDPKLPIPIDLSDQHRPGNGLYLWCPIILCLAATLLRFPPLIHRFLVRQSGLEIEAILRWAKDIKANRSDPTEIVEFVAASLKQHRLKWRLSVTFGVSKLLQLAVVSLVFVAANLTLSGHDVSAGIRFFRDLFSQAESPQYFPRIVICQMKLRAVGDMTNQHSFQCFLTLNILLEKIFASVWLMLLALIVANLLSVGYFIFGQISVNHKVDVVKKILMAKRELSPDVSRLIPSFIRSELGVDGVLLFDLITNTSGLPVSAAILLPIWDKFNFVTTPTDVGQHSVGHRLGHANS